MEEFSTLSTEYVKWNVIADHDPTGDTVQMAFVKPATSPGSSDWRTASWQTIGGLYYARCLIGSGGTGVLAVGEYSVFAKITDNPEAPVLLLGQIEIF